MALTISRSGVSSTEITQFPVADRFMKIPIERYLEEFNAGQEDQTNAPQIALINALNDPRFRFICAALSRRLGKTHIANICGQVITLIPNCNVLIMSPNYNLSSISFELQRKFTNKFGIEIVRDNLKDRILEFSNGSTVRMGSVGQVDSCVGRSYDLIIFDEAALSGAGEDAFNVALRPTLDKPGSKAIFISTPRGKNNWFSKFFQRGFSDLYPMWISIHADYTENKRMSEEDVNEARLTMSKAEFEQEYMASFNVFEGQIFNFDNTKYVFDINDFELTSEFEVIAGLDPGFRDPTAFCVIAYCASEDNYYIIDEYQATESTTQKHASAMQELIDKNGINLIFIDSAAAQFGADLAYIYDIASSKAKKNVLEGIACVQTIVETGRLRVASHCTNTLFMLDQYQWKKDDVSTVEKPEHGMASHMADALRYALYTYIT